MRYLAPVLLSLAACASTSGGALEESLATIRAVGPEGAGNVAASAAWRSVVDRGTPALIPTLCAFQDATPLAANWLRSAVDAIAERVKEPLDAGELLGFITARQRDGAARKLAYDWLIRVDPKQADVLLPRLLDDPGQELRREAVARAIAEAKGAGDALAAVFPYARDRDQVDQIAAALKKLGQKVDVQAHYGIIPKWTLLATFDNAEMK